MPSKQFQEAFEAARKQHKRNMTVKATKKKEAELDELRFLAKKTQIAQRISGGQRRRRRSRGRR